MRIYMAIGLRFDPTLIELGAVVHDAGKITYPQELDQPGSMHEVAGRELLLAHGVQPEVARFCVSHGSWQGAAVSFEERSVALADKLWKGKREDALELYIVKEAARQLGIPGWEAFLQLDSIFEEIAAGADERLTRSAPLPSPPLSLAREGTEG